jgi:hypothetical protein
LAATSGALIVGALGSGLWDMVFRPGLSGVGRFLLSLATLGSQRLRDSAYDSAALDPRPIADLLTLLTISAIPLWLLGTLWGIRSGRSRARRDRAREDGATDKEIAALRERRARASRRRFLFLNAALVILYGYMSVVAAVNNQSVLIWRQFHANLAILGPHLDPGEHLRLVSRFHAVRTREDYQRLDRALRARAAKTGVALRDFPLW